MADNSNTLSSKARAALRSLAQSLSPVVMVGQQGITEGVIGALDEALKDHELVKVRFQDFKEQTRDLSAELAEKTSSLLVSTTGFTAVFYRVNPEKRAYESVLRSARIRGTGSRSVK